MKKFIVILCTLLLVVGCGKEKQEVKPNKPEVTADEKKVQIVDLTSNKRPYAIMINNIHQAWPLDGLQNSFLNYEIIVEGGITRIMALIMEDKLPERIGSIRSSRAYYLDYALESDAIYYHWGGSPEAYEDMKTLKVDHFDGITSSYFYRANVGRSSVHSGFIKGKKVIEAAQSKKLRLTTDKGLPLKYSAESVNLSEKEGAQKANNVLIDYSNYHNTSYKYDEANKVYLRSMSGEISVDLDTKKQYTTKNIITYQVKNVGYDEKNRQTLYNIGSGNGYFISEGYAVPITWEKTCRECQTVYKYKDGSELRVNDGNTWIQIQPQGRTLKITE